MSEWYWFRSLKKGNYFFALLLNLLKWSLKWQKIITIVLKKHTREDEKVLYGKKKNKISSVAMWANKHGNSNSWKFYGEGIRDSWSSWGHIGSSTTRSSREKMCGANGNMRKKREKTSLCICVWGRAMERDISIILVTQ